MIYLLLGDDRPAKERRITELKAKHLTDDSSLKLDADSLQGDKVDAATFKKTLLSLPAVAKKRLILVRIVHKLSNQNKDILLAFIKSGFDHAVLILDTDEAAPKNKFFQSLSKASKVERFTGGEAKKNIFDVTKAMDNRDPASALRILDQVMSGGDHPLQVMGGLVWYWGRAKNRLPSERFKKGLLVLQEADLNIKRSRLKPEHAVEAAVTKLSSLIAC